MSKLEEKLIELGYEQNEFVYDKYNKVITENTFMVEIQLSISLKNMNSKIKSGCVIVNVPLRTQQDIDNLQQAFNQLQSDLEVLKDVKN